MCSVMYELWCHHRGRARRGGGLGWGWGKVPLTKICRNRTDDTNEAPTQGREKKEYVPFGVFFSGLDVNKTYCNKKE